MHPPLSVGPVLGRARELEACVRGEREGVLVSRDVVSRFDNSIRDTHLTLQFPTRLVVVPQSISIK